MTPNKDRIQQAWSHSYVHSRAFYWILTAYLLMVVAIPQDSMSRDFVLFFGLILLALTSSFREMAVKQILFGRFYVKR